MEGTGESAKGQQVGAEGRGSRNGTDEEGKKEFTNCKMQLSAFVRGVSRSGGAGPAVRVGGEASVPGV